MPAACTAASVCGAPTTAAKRPSSAARIALSAAARAARPWPGATVPSAGRSCFTGSSSIPSSDRPQARACSSSTARSPTSTGRQRSSTAGSRAALSEISGPMPAGSPVAMATLGFTLVDLHVGGANDSGPALRFLAHVGSRLRRSESHRFRGKGGKPGLNIGVAQRFAHAGRDFLSDRRRQTRRTDYSEPGHGLETRQRFGERRHVGQRRDALCACHRERLDAPGFHVRERYAEVVAHHVDLARHQRGQGWRGALVRYVGNLQPARHALEELGGEVRRSAVALGGVVELAGICPGVGDQIGHGRHRQLRVHQQYVRDGGDHADRDKLGRIEGEPGIQQPVDHERRRRRGEKRIAIRLGLEHRRRADVAGGAGAVVHDHRLAEFLGQLLAHDARQQGRAAAGRERHGDSYRLSGAGPRPGRGGNGTMIRTGLAGQSCAAAAAAENTRIKKGRRNQSTLMFASFTTLPQRARSALISPASSPGVLVTGINPCLTSCSRTSGSAMTAFTSAFSRATSAAGVLPGAMTAYQASTSSMKSMPCSRNVGASGYWVERSAPVTASARSLPARTYGMEEWMSVNIICTWPPTRSVIAPAKPLYGTCVTSSPRRCLMSSMPTWCGVPLPGDAKKYLPGLARMSATACFMSLAGKTLGFTAKVYVASAIFPTGARSSTGS